MLRLADEPPSARSRLGTLLEQLDARLPRPLLDEACSRMVLAPTLHELERVYQRFKEDGFVPPRGLRPRKPPPNTGRHLGREAGLFDPCGTMVAFLIAHRHCLFDLPAETPVDASNLLCLGADRLATCLVDVRKWSGLHPVVINLDDLQARMDAREPVYSGHRGVARQDPHVRFVKELIECALVSSKRLCATEHGDPLITPPTIAALQDLLPLPRPVPVVRMGTLPKFAIGLWIQEITLEGRPGLRPLVERIPGSFSEALAGVSAAITYRLSRCIITWPAQKAGYANAKFEKRRTTLVLPRQWLERARSKSDTNAYHDALGEALATLDAARRNAGPTNADLALVFLRLCWENSSKPFLSDDATIAELQHLLDLRKKAFSKELGKDGVKGWRRFRIENDKRRTMDAHDWYRAPW